MKDLLSLFLIFFKIGIVNFGGGYAMLPLLEHELCEKRGWATEEELANYYAVGQSTPGPIAINVSTFIGYKRKGVLGGIVSTLGFITPAFIIIFLIASILSGFKDNQYVKHAVNGINLVVIPLILFGISKLLKKSIVDIFSFILTFLTAILAITVKVIPLYSYVIFAGIYGLVISLIKESKFKQNNDCEDVEDKDIESLKIDRCDEKKDHKSFIFGFLLGLIIGAFSIIVSFIKKNKKLQEGIYSGLILWIIMLISTLVFIFNNHNFIFFRIYFNFFRIGLCAFGGGLATLPFLAELSKTTSWFSISELNMMIAVSESTPGAIGVNMSTYVGYLASMNSLDNKFLGFLGSIIGTLGLVSPSVITILIISLFLKKFKDNKYVNYVLYGLRAASLGLIICAWFSIIISQIFIDYQNVSSFKYAFNNASGTNILSKIANFFDLLIDFKLLAISIIFGILIFKFKKHPLFYIVLGIFVGLLLQL